MSKKETYDNSDQSEEYQGLGKELIQKAERCFSTPERYNAERTWYQLAEFVLPSQFSEFFRNPVKGVRRDRRKFDDTAVLANRDLSSAIHATITNPSMKWSKLRFRDDKMNDNEDSTNWLSETSEQIHNYLSDSNFDAQVGRCYSSLSGLGQMILFHDELYEDNGAFKGFNFQAWHLAEVAFEENHLGTIDTIYRRFRMSIKAAYDKFGDKIGQDMIEKMKSNPQEDLDFYHCIYPRKDMEVEINPVGLALPNKRPFASMYVMQKGMRIVKEDGYYEFPCYVARWSSLPGETYGYGPANTCLSDVRSLNKMRQELLKSMAKANDPPIFTTKQNQMSGDMRPGGVVYVRDIQQIKEFVTQARFDVVMQQVEVLVNSIKASFYIDKLLLPPRTETGEMTAYEVQQRLQQMQTILGPVVSRLDTEFLTPFIMRCLKILYRANQLMPMPKTTMDTAKKGRKGMKAIDLDVKFVNSLARNQQLGELENVKTWMQEILQSAQMDPTIIDTINFDAVVQYSARIRDIPEELVRTTDEVKKIRDQRQKQQQAQQMLNMGEQASNIAKNGAQAHQATQPQGGGNGQ